MLSVSEMEEVHEEEVVEGLEEMGGESVNGFWGARGWLVVLECGR